MISTLRTLASSVARLALVTTIGAWSLAGARTGTAQTFVLPENGDTVVGELALASSVYEDTLLDIGRAYSQGFYDMRLANPHVDTWIPGAGTEILVPSQYILPEAPQEGIIINVPEMRLYYYPNAKPGQRRMVQSYAISIGRQDWRTPYGLTKVVAKVERPTWYPPKSILKEHAEDGDPLPRAVPPGPDNPLGEYALRLGLPGYLIHGTNKPGGVGMRVTHGCIRLYPKDIEWLFSNTRVGTPVRLVNQPVKLGRLQGALYVESHPPLEEHHDQFADHFTHIVDRVIAMAEQSPREIQDVDWQRLRRMLARPNGIPERIGPTGAVAPLPLLGNDQVSLLP